MANKLGSVCLFLFSVVAFCTMHNYAEKRSWVDSKINKQRMILLYQLNDSSGTNFHACFLDQTKWMRIGIIDAINENKRVQSLY